MERVFPQRVNWKNLPDRTTPINQTNLNKSDEALYIIDDRVVTLDATKFDKTSANALLKNFQLNTTTGVITLTWYDNSTVTIDTALEKIAVNFDYDPTTQQLILYDVSGQVLQRIDLSTFITQYEFSNSSTIAFSVSSAGNVSASIRDGSVTENMLQSGYLADITAQASAAASSASAASSSANDADYDAKLSQSYSVGNSGIRAGEDTDNSKYYKEQSALSATASANSASDSNSYAEDSEAWAVGKRDGTDVSSTDPTYQNNSKYYSEQSSNSANSALSSAGNASSSATSALSSSQQAQTSANNAASSATSASIYASQSATATADSLRYAGLAENASSSAISASSSAQGYKDDAEDSALDSEAWAVGKRGGEDVSSTDTTYHNNAKYYADVASRAIATAGSLSGIFQIDSSDGHLYLGDLEGFDGTFSINQTTGHMHISWP